jgi:hypothetical protein
MDIMVIMVDITAVVIIMVDIMAVITAIIMAITDITVIVATIMATTTMAIIMAVAGGTDGGGVTASARAGLGHPLATTFGSAGTEQLTVSTR